MNEGKLWDNERLSVTFNVEIEQVGLPIVVVDHSEAGRDTGAERPLRPTSRRRSS